MSDIHSFVFWIDNFYRCTGTLRRHPKRKFLV